MENVTVKFWNAVISLYVCIVLTTESELELVAKVTERSTVN